MSIIQPVVNHVKSPVSARAILMFLMLGLFGLVILFHYLEEWSAERRHKETLDNDQRAEISREALKQQNDVIEKALKRIEDFAGNDRESNENQAKLVQNQERIADILKLDRAARQKENARIERALKRRGGLLPTCYELRRRVDQIGSANVSVVELVPKTKCQ